ncbi:MAG: hypothetical protein V1729_04385 [Candidatus Woesearchaeota archaeon]
MAKKKNGSDEDWFEDYDEEADGDQPKKKKVGKVKKKKSKALLWIAAFVVILALLLFIRFRYAAPAESEEVIEFELPPADIVEEQQVPEPETARPADEYSDRPSKLGDSVVTREDVALLEGVDTTVKPELFGNVECAIDEESGLRYISLRIYNTLDEDIRISPRGVAKEYNTYFMIRGIIDKDPGCGTELLEAGEWTTCNKIGFDAERYANMAGINRISVQVPGKTEALLVNCPAD